MKPKYENVYGLRFIDQGYRGVYRILGKPAGVIEPGRVWGVPVFVDIAKVDVRPKSMEVELEAVSKDQQKFGMNPMLYHWVIDPMSFLDNAPVDYDGKLAGILKHDIGVQVPQTYTLQDLMGARQELADHLSNQMREYLQQRGWGLDVDVFVPELSLPSVSPRELDVGKIRRDHVLPLQKQLKVLEAEIAGLEAKKFSETQQQMAEGYKVLITSIMTARAAGMEKLAGAYQKVAESILGPFEGKLEPAYIAWILNGIVRDAIGPNEQNEQLGEIDRRVEELVGAGISGKAIQARAQASGVNTTLTSILQTAENVVPQIIQGISRNAPLEDVDRAIRGRYGR